MDSELIDPGEIAWSSLSQADQVGSVFNHRGRVLRAIRPGQEASVHALLQSGLPAELTRRKLLPQTEIAKARLEGAAMVLQHRRLPVTSYPYEWSLSMLADAGRCVLAINQLANRYGYQLKDCHPYNVLFDGLAPVFVDFGSFAPLQEGSQNWLAYEEFVRSYLYPARIWASGNHYLAQKICADLELMPHSAYLLYEYAAARPLARFLPAVEKALYLYYRARLVSAYPESVLRERISPRLEAVLDGAIALQRRGVMPLQRVDMARLRGRLDRSSQRHDRSLWGNYHAELLTEDNEVRSTPRFDRVVEIARELQPSTALELGGNRGVLSRLLLARTNVERVICTDRDELAIDELYRGCREREPRLHAAVLDLMAPTSAPGLPSASERFRSQLVLALALTHHLFLRPPYYSFERVLDTLASYSERYLLVEFMPLGLLDKGRAPRLPAGYTLERFRAAFTQRFRLLREEALEPNRVLLVGELHSSRSRM